MIQHHSEAPLDRGHALYAGSFDPLTLGHVDLIRRSAAVFSRVTVGVGINPDKHPLFSPEERVRLLEDVIRDLPNVGIDCFHGLTVEFAREIGAGVLVRGIRSLSDTESEFTMTLANHHLEPRIETVFLMASEQYTHVSSSLIKQIARLGSSSVAEQLQEFVPTAVISPLLAKFRPPA